MGGSGGGGRFSVGSRIVFTGSTTEKMGGGERAK